MEIQEQAHDRLNCLYTLHLLADITLYGSADYARAAQFCQRAIALCDELHDLDALASALSTLAEIHRLQGQLTEARAEAERSLALAELMGSRKARAHYLFRLSKIDVDAGRVEESVQNAALSLALCRDLQDRWGMVYLLEHSQHPPAFAMATESSTATPGQVVSASTLPAFTPAPAALPADFSPILYGQKYDANTFSLLLGGVQAGKWLTPEQAASLIRGTTEYAIHTSSLDMFQVLGYAPESTPIRPGQYTIGSDSTRADFGMLGVAHGWPVRKGQAQELSPENETYRQLVLDWLQEAGVDDPQLGSLHIFRVDLEGDGADHFNTWFWIIALPGFAHRWLNCGNRLLRYVSEASYPFYILHQTVIVMIGTMSFDGTRAFPQSSSPSASHHLLERWLDTKLSNVSMQRAGYLGLSH